MSIMMCDYHGGMFDSDRVECEDTKSGIVCFPCLEKMEDEEYDKLINEGEK